MIYADRLSRAGVPVELHMYPRAYHGFYRVTNARVTKQAEHDNREALRRFLHGYRRTLHRFCQAFTPSASANRGQRLRTPTALQRTPFAVVTRRVSATGASRSYPTTR
jgi:acetyl esterase/lipase